MFCAWLHALRRSKQSIIMHHTIRNECRWGGFSGDIDAQTGIRVYGCFVAFRPCGAIMGKTASTGTQETLQQWSTKHQICYTSIS